jgi:predicted transcriptional regulator
MASILDLTSDIVSSHASTSQMTSEELVLEIQKVHAALKALEAGIEIVSITGEDKPALTVKEAFKKNEVICMVCGKGKMKTITRHLSTVHEMKPGQYRKQFGIPSKQPLTAKSFSESRKKMAEEKGLGAQLVKAREVRMAKIKAKKSMPVKAVKPKVVKKAAPAKTVKAAAPKVAKKTDTPF